MNRLKGTLLAAALCVVACDTQSSESAVGKEAPPSAPAATLKVSPNMQTFTEEFRGSPDKLVEALKKRTDDPKLLDPDGQTVGGTIAFMRDLKNTKVTGYKKEGDKDCYALSGEEFPDDPEEHTLHTLRVCWVGEKIVILNAMTFGSEL